MLKEYRDKPIWYKLWMLSALIGLLYFLIKLFLYDELNFFDRLLNLYGLLSVFTHRYLEESKKEKEDSA